MKLKSKYLLLILLALLACVRDKNHPGYSYYPDMYYSQAYETFAENPPFSDTTVMKGPVQGTVSREMQPYVYNKGEEGRQKAGRYYINPLETSDLVLKKGGQMYTLICMQCHGDLGDGKGFLFTEKLYPYQPANLLLEKTKNIPDGEIYHVVTVGFNLMGAHGSMLNANQRWAIILYIRELQRK